MKIKCTTASSFFLSRSWGLLSYADAIRCLADFISILRFYFSWNINIFLLHFYSFFYSPVTSMCRFLLQRPKCFFTHLFTFKRLIKCEIVWELLNCRAKTVGNLLCASKSFRFFFPFETAIFIKVRRYFLHSATISIRDSCAFVNIYQHVSEIKRINSIRL